MFEPALSLPPPAAAPAPTKPEQKLPTASSKPEQVAQITKPPVPAAPAPLVKPNVPEAPPEVKEEKVLLRIDAIRGASASANNSIRQSLEKLNYVKLTSAAFFDRLIRGEITEDVYHVRLLNPIGDVIQMAPTKDIEELTTDIAARLETDYIVKQLSRLHNPRPSFKVKVWVTDEKRSDFRVGEKVVFNFRSDEDCYLLIINTDSQGNIHLIFPNRFYPANFIKGVEERRIPDERMGQKFELEFGGPTGEETVKVIATKEPIDLGDARYRQAWGTLQGEWLW